MQGPSRTTQPAGPGPSAGTGTGTGTGTGRDMPSLQVRHDLSGSMADMSDQPHRNTWDRWSWPTFYTGIIALGIVLHLTMQLPAWALISIPLALTAAYLLTDWLIRRRRTDPT